MLVLRDNYYSSPMIMDEEDYLNEVLFSSSVMDEDEYLEKMFATRGVPLRPEELKKLTSMLREGVMKRHANNVKPYINHLNVDKYGRPTELTRGIEKYLKSRDDLIGTLKEGNDIFARLRK